MRRLPRTYCRRLSLSGDRVNVLWMTDPHLNFLPDAAACRQLGGQLLQEHRFEAVVLSGDIAEAPTLRHLLTEFAHGVAPRPVYFVLGNHDYYHGSFESVQSELRAGFEAPNLVWLDDAGVTVLDGETALVGHQGWFDARLGDPQKSRVIMADFEYIAELREHYVNELNWIYGGRSDLLTHLETLGRQTASQAKSPLMGALRARKTVVFVTHFPPFKEACWHEGAISDRHWLPWFTCQAMGDMLAEMALAHRDRRLLVLCGHTHSSGVYDHAPNLRVLTGRAVYGKPSVAKLLTLPIADWDSEAGEVA